MTTTDRLTDSFEQAALAKYFSPFFRIDQKPDGSFETRTPGLAGKNGDIWGMAVWKSLSWVDARNRLLGAFRDHEKPTRDNLLDLSVGDKGKIVFSSFDSYAPISAPTAEEYPVPRKIGSLLGMDKPADPRLTMLANTARIPGFEQDLFTLVTDNAEKTGLKEKLGIADFKALTPRQAMGLTARTVLNLTKFCKDNAREADGQNVCDLLREGVEMRDDPAWKGRGVCRHFASAMQAVYDAIKSHQGQFSLLRNTYCLTEVELESHNGASYGPKRKKHRLTREDITKNYPGHAWNKFVTLTHEGEADVTIADITWADRNSAKRDKIRNIDFTRTRMEPLVREIATAGNLDAVVDYYARAISSPGAGKEEKAAFATNAVSVLRRTGVPDKLPPGFSKSVFDQFAGLIGQAGPLEIETLYKIAEKDPFADIDTILTAYVDKKKVVLPDGSLLPNGLIFERSDDLQKRIFEKLKAIPDFQAKIEKSPILYKRMMDVYPALSRDFSPVENILHGKALIFQINTSSHLSALNKRYNFVFCEVLPNEANPLDADGVQNLIAAARQNLIDFNPEAYRQTVKDMTDYDLLTRYDALCKTIKIAQKPALKSTSVSPP